jgi:hypothetical protein
MGFRRTFIIKTPGAGSRVKGKWVDGALVESTIEASVQPMNGEDLQSVPENRRASGVYKIFTSSNLILLSEATNPPLIIIDGEDFEIFHKEPWKNNVINHHVYFAARKKTPVN